METGCDTETSDNRNKIAISSDSLEVAEHIILMETMSNRRLELFKPEFRPNPLDGGSAVSNRRLELFKLEFRPNPLDGGSAVSNRRHNPWDGGSAVSNRRLELFKLKF